jgi:hypothetical protein
MWKAGRKIDLGVTDREHGWLLPTGSPSRQLATKGVGTVCASLMLNFVELPRSTDEAMLE